MLSAVGMLPSNSQGAVLIPVLPGAQGQHNLPKVLSGEESWYSRRGSSGREAWLLLTCAAPVPGGGHP